MVNGKSFAEMSAEEKDKLSHRGKALNLLLEKLNDYMSL
jgi:inosine/xanthosine triphosphate pyrophosphatase family protein